MDRASRALCKTSDNGEALRSGRWLCHESCWECAEAAMSGLEPVDHGCCGGIRMYAVPILANGSVVGALNFGYGDPPRDPARLRELAATFEVDHEDLRRQAEDYEPRSPETIELAKRRLRTAAQLIGALVERTVAEEALRERESQLKESEARFREVYDCASVGIARLSLDFRIEGANPALCAFLGRDEQDLIGHALDGYAVAADGEELARYRRLVAQGRSDGFHMEPTFVDVAGTPVHGLLAVRLIRDGDGAPSHLLACVNDLSERRRLDEALRTNERRFHRMLDIVPDMISIHSADMEVLYSNWQGFADVPAERRVLNQKCHFTYRGLDEICPDCLAKKVLTTKEPLREEAKLPDGAWIDIRVFPLLDEKGDVESFVEWVRDITVRKREEAEREALQTQLLHALKMESIGRLAGGVAHDFNNMLGVIVGNAELALDEIDPSERIFGNLQEINRAAERSTALTKQLLAFARKQTSTPRTLDLNEAIEATLKMLRRLIGEDIDLVWKPSGDLPPIRFDPAQLDQILANLCLNARDAIDRKGKLTIETAAATFQEGDCADHVGLVPGRYVVLSVSDTGSGVDSDALEHIFEPFYTTKATGTGLGLASVYGIVEQNQGFIKVHSEAGKGTTFRIHLPAFLDEAAAEACMETDAPTPRRGHETILLVEDEMRVLTVVTQMIERLGYQVILASRPDEAIALADRHEGPIDLLVTDVVMPGMNGRTLAEALRARRPELKCLFMSGYTGNVIVHHGVLDEGVHFVQKPFKREAIAEAIRKALES